MLALQPCWWHLPTRGRTVHLLCFSGVVRKLVYPYVLSLAPRVSISCVCHVLIEETNLPSRRCHPVLQADLWGHLNWCSFRRWHQYPRAFKRKYGRLSFEITSILRVEEKFSL